LRSSIRVEKVGIEDRCEGCDMNKIITSALLAASVIGAMATATSASAQDWGPPPPPPHHWDGGPGDWRGPPPPPPPPYYGDWRARRDWEWRDYQRRRYEEMRRREWCRWNRCW
jgi:hypothetical protein